MITHYRLLALCALTFLSSNALFAAAANTIRIEEINEQYTLLRNNNALSTSEKPQLGDILVDPAGNRYRAIATSIEVSEPDGETYVQSTLLFVPY